MNSTLKLPDFCLPFPETGGRVDSVVVRNWGLSLDDVKKLAELSQIRELRIDSRSLELEVVQELARIPHFKSIVFTSSAITDRHVELIGQHLSVETLGLCGKNITDSCLPFIRHLRLRSLGLPDTRVSDAGVAELAAGTIAKQLRYLNLSGTNVTNATIREMDRFPLLRKLSLRSTNINDSGIAVLPNQFTWLDLSETNISDHSSAHFSRLSNLEYLTLVRTSIGAEMVRTCLSLPTLRVLDVSNSNVDDSVADQDIGTSLEAISVYATRMTTTGIEKLRSRYPTLAVQTNAR